MLQKAKLRTRTCELAELLGELERLHREVAGRGQDERADTSARVAAAEPIQHGQQEGGGLPGARAGHGGDVDAGEDERHGLALDRRGHAVPLVAHPAVDLLAEPHRLEPAGLGFLASAGLGLLAAAAAARRPVPLRPLLRLRVRLRRGFHAGGRRALGLPGGFGLGRV